MLTMTLTGPRLQDPIDWNGPEERVRYMLGVPTQIGPTTAAMLCNLHAYGHAVDDLEAGVDAIVFDDLAAIEPRNAVPLLRNETVKHPEHGGAMLLVKNVVFAGFVPLGTKLPDGSPHPHAGTGFGMSTVLGFPADHSVGWPAGDANIFHREALQQYRYDGKRFEVTSTTLLEPERVMPGWIVASLPLCNAIADGEDLLWPMDAAKAGTRADGAKHAGGIVMTRWRRGSEGWRPIDCSEVTGDDASTEPSFVRDMDGALLLTVRGADHRAVRHGRITADATRAGWRQVWRSRDNGRTWEKTIDQPAHCNPGPISIHRTAGGRIFLAGTPVTPPVIGPNGNPVSPGAVRSPLALWELSGDRRSVGAPKVVLDCDARFGPAPRRGNWLADHPISAVLRLRDGVRSVLCFRVAALDETSTGADSTPNSGCWCEEVREA